MTTTSLGLSKRLYAAFPSWDGTDFVWADHGNDSFLMYSLTTKKAEHYPRAYDLEFLLDKLPDNVAIKKLYDGEGYRAYAPSSVAIESIVGATATEAAGELALKLYER